MSVSDADVRLFQSLVNPQKTKTEEIERRITRSQSRQESDNENSEEDEEESEESEGSENEESGEENESETEDALSERKTHKFKTPSPRGSSAGESIASRASRHVSPKKEYTFISQDEHNDLDKQTVLMDIERLKMQGVKFSKEWSLNDSLEDMQFEVRRHMLSVQEANNLNMMRDGMRMICTGIEMLNSKFNILELNGWSATVCQDMSKYDPALGKLYRKYWRRSTYQSPEMEIAMSVISSMGMYHFKKKLSMRMFTPSSATRQSSVHKQNAKETYSDSDSEDLPP